MTMTNMKVNPLPSITWHWLGMNESELDMPYLNEDLIFSLKGGDGKLRWISGLRSDAFRATGRGDDTFTWPGWNDMETGMGAEFSAYIGNAPIAYLDIPAGYTAKVPAVISVDAKTNAAGQIRINAGAGSDASVVIAIRSGDEEGPDAYRGSGTASGTVDDTMAVQLKLHAQEGSHLRLFVVQTLPMQGIACLDAGGVCEERAGVEFVDLSLGAQKAYTGITMKLLGDVSSFAGDMGYRVKAFQNVDINYVARHEGRGSKSRMNAWGVLEEDSRKLFRGTIDFHEGCSGSVGAEKEDVLLMGERQVNQTIPLILCHEEDVQGDHGATISRLDEGVIFYLGSRGIDPKTAENMIARARLEALCAMIPDDDIRHEAEKLISTDIKNVYGRSADDGSLHFNKRDFPIFQEESLIYLDNAATAQKPFPVLDAERAFYERSNANPLRGLYELGMEATESYENARERTARFINAARPEEIIFTRNTTESINLVSYSYAQNFLKPGDEILITIAEHHSNLLPWQEAAKRSGAVLKFLDCEQDGTFLPERIEMAVTPKTKLAAICHVSNVTGRVSPVEDIISRVHAVGGVVLIDAAQSAPHMPIDVKKLDCDFLAFSGHKMMGPMGIGVLYGKYDILNAMPPFLTGGEMIDSVTRESAVFAPIPHKFEAGTVNAAGAAGLSAAMDYIEGIGWTKIGEREKEMTRQAFEGMGKIPYVHIIGSDDPDEHNGILSFTITGVHPHDIASIMDASGICLRAGHHCAMPLLKHLGINSCARASIAFYNTPDDIERFLGCLSTVRRMMGYGE